MPVKDASTLKVGDIITKKKLQEVFHMLPDQVIPFGDYVGIGLLALAKGNGQTDLMNLPIIPIFYAPTDTLENAEIIKTVTENNKKLKSKLTITANELGYLNKDPDYVPAIGEYFVINNKKLFIGNGTTPIKDIIPIIKFIDEEEKK